MKIRIKTEQEFLKEFGEGWRNKTQRPFTKSMDYLFNRQYYIPVELFEKLISWKTAIIGKDIVSIDMVVFPPAKPMRRKSNLKYILI